jgi:hypothetical protein
VATELFQLLPALLLADRAVLFELLGFLLQIDFQLWILVQQLFKRLK